MVIGITREGVAVRTSEGVDMVLPQGDSFPAWVWPRDQHASGPGHDHRSGHQGDAFGRAAPVNQRLTHVMATRVRDDLTIYTNDRDALLRSIEANPGDKASARLRMLAWPMHQLPVGAGAPTQFTSAG
jgi:hypothetical protein